MGRIWESFLGNMAGGQGPFSQFTSAYDAHRRNQMRDALMQKQFDLKTEELRKVKIPGVAVNQQNAETNATNANTRIGELGLNTQKLERQRQRDYEAPILKGLDPQGAMDWRAAMSAAADPTNMLTETPEQTTARIQSEAAKRASGRAGLIAGAQNASALNLHQKKREYDMEHPPITGRAANDPLIKQHQLRGAFFSALNRYNAARVEASKPGNQDIDLSPFKQQLNQLAGEFIANGWRVPVDAFGNPTDMQNSTMVGSQQSPVTATSTQTQTATTSSLSPEQARAMVRQLMEQRGMTLEQAVQAVKGM